MTAIDELKAMQQEMDLISEQIKMLDAEKIELQKKLDGIKSKIDFGVRLSQEYEEKALEKAAYDSEALSTLFVKFKTGSLTVGDFQNFCEETSLELPELEPSETEEAAKEASQEVA